MALKTIFVTVRWLNANVIFEDRKKLILRDEQAKTIVLAGVNFRREVAERVAVSHFGQPVDTVVGQLYFEIFDSKTEDADPIFRSENAPED